MSASAQANQSRTVRAVTAPARPVDCTVPLDVSSQSRLRMPLRGTTLDCSQAVLRMPLYVIAKQQSEKLLKRPAELLTFRMVQQCIRDYFVRDLDDEAELLSRRYILTGAHVEQFFHQILRRADEQAVVHLSKVCSVLQDHSSRLGDMLVAILTRQRHVLLQGTELTLMELKERVLLAARLQEPLSMSYVHRLAFQMGPNNRALVEEWLRSHSQKDPVDSLALWTALRDKVHQLFGSFSFSGAYYQTVLDDLIDRDERSQSSMVYPPKQEMPPQCVRARVCEEVFIFTIFCGIPLSLDTYYLAVALLDRFLAIRSIPKEELRLYSMSSLLLASKCDHSWPTLDPHFVALKMKLPQEDIMKTEEEIVETLQFDMTISTLHHFSEALLLHQDPPASPEQRRLLEYLIASLSIHTYHGQYKQSYLAAAALHCSRRAARLATGELSEPVRLLLPVLYAALQKNNIERGPGNLVKQIYAQPERHAFIGLIQRGAHLTMEYMLRSQHGEIILTRKTEHTTNT